VFKANDARYTPVLTQLPVIGLVGEVVILVAVELDGLLKTFTYMLPVPITGMSYNLPLK